MKKVKKLWAWLILFVLIVSGCNNQSEPDVYIQLGFHTPESYDFTLDYLIGRSEKIIYGEVISRDDSSAEPFGYYRDKGAPMLYCVTNLKIKVLENIKGESEGEILYRETGGTAGNTVYYNYMTGSLKEGEKAILFLTENDMLAGIETKGSFKETADGSFYVSKSLLKEGTYKETPFTRVKVEKNEFINYLKSAVSKHNGKKEYDIMPGGIETLKSDLPLYNNYHLIEDAVYGEVINIGDTESYDINLWTNEGSKTFNYQKRKVEIKVIERAKGSGGTVIYNQPIPLSGVYDEEFAAYYDLKCGDKLVICLTKEGDILSLDSLLIADSENKVEVNGSKLDAKEYINQLKESYKETEAEIKAEEEEWRAREHKLVSGYTEVSYYPHHEVTIDDILEDTDMIIYGSAEISGKQIFNEKHKNRGAFFPTMIYENCFTEVDLKNTVCFYNRYGTTEMKDLKYLQSGGETELVYFYPQGPFIDENADMLLFLRYNGANYEINYQFKVGEGGYLNVPENLIPKGYEEECKREKNVLFYGNILSSYLKEVE